VSAAQQVQSVSVGLSLPPGLATALKADAEAAERTVAGHVRFIVREYLVKAGRL
jgi:hypothetical protein